MLAIFSLRAMATPSRAGDPRPGPASRAGDPVPPEVCTAHPSHILQRLGPPHASIPRETSCCFGDPSPFFAMGTVGISRRRRFVFLRRVVPGGGKGAPASPMTTMHWNSYCARRTSNRTNVSAAAFVVLTMPFESVNAKNSFSKGLSPSSAKPGDET